MAFLFSLQLLYQVFIFSRSGYIVIEKLLLLIFIFPSKLL
jgi:hypothetical protein